MSHNQRLPVSVLLRQLGLAGLVAIFMAPPFAWLFQHEPVAGVVGTGLVAAGASYLAIRKQSSMRIGGAVAIACAVAGAAAGVAWSLRVLWGAWIA